MSNNNNGHDDRFTITARDLLQANATILAGVLIFLSIAVSFAGLFGRPLPLIGVIGTAASSIPFVWSCETLLKQSNDREEQFRMARVLTGIGLVSLTLTIATFLAFSQYDPATNNDDDNEDTTNTTAINTTTIPNATNITSAADTVATVPTNDTAG